MSERTQNIIWMTEQLDFNSISPDTGEQIEHEMRSFLESTANDALSHRFVRPSDSLFQLEASLEELHSRQPFSVTIDLTRGRMSNSLAIMNDVPVISNLSISRIRQADKADLPTTGHLLSHNAEEIREIFKEIETDHTLILDDTSFSGTTSAILEQVLRQAMPDREIQFTHGFLILNEGELGGQEGSKKRLEHLGSLALGGTNMRTPVDDGWHFFDMIEQKNFEAHIEATLDALHSPKHRPTPDELKILFPEMITYSELSSAHKIGRFVTQKEINGDLHVRNPQLLPSIIKQGHLMPPEKWRSDENTTIGHLKAMHQLLKP